MAFYSLWKWFSPWSKVDYPDMIFWYKEYVLKSSKQRRLEKIESKKRVSSIMASLGIMHAMCNNLY